MQVIMRDISLYTGEYLQHIVQHKQREYHNCLYVASSRVPVPAKVWPVQLRQMLFTLQRAACASDSLCKATCEQQSSRIAIGLNQTHVVSTVAVQKFCSLM